MTDYLEQIEVTEFATVEITAFVRDEQNFIIQVKDFSGEGARERAISWASSIFNLDPRANYVTLNTKILDSENLDVDEIRQICSDRFSSGS
jgi:hypothetical protein